jgi:hypothetical protein
MIKESGFGDQVGTCACVYYRRMYAKAVGWADSRLTSVCAFCVVVSDVSFPGWDELVIWRWVKM